MENALSPKILSVNWQHYLSRPFNLFETSVWNKWYDSHEIEALITKKAVALRATSYYPQIFSELLVPAAKRELSKQNKISIDLLPYALIDEVKRGDAGEIFEERKKLSDAGNNFIYFNDGDLVEVDADKGVVRIIK